MPIDTKTHKARFSLKIIPLWSRMPNKMKEMNMEMPPEHKIWAVVNAIQEAMAIGPKGSILEIDPKELQKYLSLAEIRQIFEKLAKDDDVIELVHLPGGVEIEGLFLGDQKTISFRIKNDESFRAFYSKVHAQFFGGPEKMSGDNFLAVMDVTRDIHEELEMSSASEVTIPIKRDIIRFSILYPSHSPNMMDRYCRLRMKAVKYLKENGHIKDYDVTRENWDSTISISLDRLDFTKFFKRLLNVYPTKMKPDDEKTAAGIPGQFRFSEAILRRDGVDAIEKFAEDSHEHSVMKTAFSSPIGTRIDNATDGIEMDWRKLYDTANRLNDKIERKFGVKGFFKIEFKDKYIERIT